MEDETSAGATGTYSKRVRYRLLVVLPDGSASSLEVGQSPISVGRSVDSDVRIDELHVSRQHCLLHQRAARLMVLDQGSTHGTVVNGAKVRQAQLRHGDVLRVGSAEIRVQAVGSDETGDLPVPAERPIGTIQADQAIRETALPAEGTTAKLGLVYRLGGLLANSVDLSGAADAVLELVLEALPVDRVMVVLTNEAGGPEIDPPLAAKLREGTEPFEVGPSVTVIGKVIEDGIALHSLDVASDEVLSRSQSLTHLDVRVVMCAPLHHGDEVLGLLYADSRAGPSAPTEEDMVLFEAVADQAALALGRARMHSELVAQHQLVKEQRDQLDALSRSLERRAMEKSALAEERAIALAERLDELEQLQGARETMAQCLVHDVRNMVSAIDLSLQYLGLVVKGNSRAEQAAVEGQEVGSRILALVEDVLTVSRMEAGLVEVKPKLVAVAGLFSAAVRRNATLARDNQVSLALGEIPPGTAVVADPRLLERVFDNLIGNALRYAGAEGKVTLWSRRREGQVELAVTDTGPGVKPEERSLVFEKWYQSGGRQGKHHGLGLHFCQLAAEAHGGRISIEGGPGENTFVVTVPARDDIDEDTTL